MECLETLDDLKTLVDTEMEVKLLDLEGVTIPSIAPNIPPPPPNFDFYYNNQEEMTNQTGGAAARGTRRGIALGSSRMSTPVHSSNHKSS